MSAKTTASATSPTTATAPHGNPAGVGGPTAVVNMDTNAVSGAASSSVRAAVETTTV